MLPPRSAWWSGAVSESTLKGPQLYVDILVEYVLSSTVEAAPHGVDGPSDAVPPHEVITS